MRVTIIGAGRVGRTLGRLAREAGYDIGEVVCRSSRSARAAVRFIGAGNAHSAANPKLERAHLVLISTPDDALDEAAQLLMERGGRVGPAVALHTSGGLPSDALNPLRAHDFRIGSCHPLQSFADPQRALRLVRDCYFCLEGDPAAVKAARRFVRRLGARCFEIPKAVKGLYHAAAVLGSGGSISLLSISLEALVACGLDEKTSIRVLMPLVEGTLVNLKQLGPVRALTGPVKRADVGTVSRNVKSLAEVDAQWAEVYRQLGLRALTLADRAGVDKRSLRRVMAALRR